MDHLCEHEMLKKAQKKKCNTILERRYKDDEYRKSLSDIGWTEEIALEDHAYAATRRKKSEREFMETLIERRRCTRIIESAQ